MFLKTSIEKLPSNSLLSTLFVDFWVTIDDAGNYVGSMGSDSTLRSISTFASSLLRSKELLVVRYWAMAATVMDLLILLGFYPGGTRRVNRRTWQGAS
jgi:hypothetical protein